MERLFNSLNRLAGLNEAGELVNETSFIRLPEALMSGSVEPLQLSEFQRRFARQLRAALLGMSGTDPITLDILPDQIRNSYVSSDGSRFLTNFLPVQNPWEVGFRRIYTAQLESVTDRATGMVLASDQMYQIAEVDGVRAAITALAVILVLLLIDFRNIALSILTLLPFLLSFGALFGLMAITGIKFDFINIIAVPLLIGMGVDDAVHLNHRYLLEGKGMIHVVIAKTGTAVLVLLSEKLRISITPWRRADI